MPIVEWQLDSMRAKRPRLLEDELAIHHVSKSNSWVASNEINMPMSDYCRTQLPKVQM